MKNRVVSFTLPVSNTTFDLTDPSINGDWKGAILLGGAPNANDTNTANMEFFIGAVDAGGRSVCFAQQMVDATSGAAARSWLSAVTCLAKVPTGGGIPSIKGAYSSTLSNGVRLALSANDGVAHQAKAVLLAGADNEFAVSSGNFATTDTSKIITHNLTGIPSWVWVICNFNTNLDPSSAVNYNFVSGFYDGNSSIGFGGSMGFGTNPTSIGARCGTADMGHWVGNTPSDLTNVTISVVGASTLTISRGSSFSSPGSCIVMAGRNLSSIAAAAAFVNTTPTSTGVNVVKVGMAVAPTLWISLPTRRTATTFANDDTAGSWGACIATNTAGTSQYGALAAMTKSGVTGSSVCKTQISSANACETLDNTGAVTFASTVQSWDAGGVTENVATAGASAFERINLLFGIQPASQSSFAPLGPGISPVAQTQFETFPFSNANALQPYFPPPGSNAPLLSLIWGPGNSPNPQTQFERFPFSTLPPPINITIGGILASNSTLYGVLGLATLPTAQALGQPSPGVQPYADSQFRMFPFSNSAANTTSFAQGLLQSNSLFYGTLIGTGALGAIMPPNSTFFGFLTPITLGQIAGLWQSNSTVYANLTGIGNIAGLSLSNSLLSALKIGSGFQPLVPNTPVLDVRTDTGYEPWSVRPGKTIG